MDMQPYKTRTNDVRRAARAHLADLRRARRLAKARMREEDAAFDMVENELEELVDSVDLAPAEAETISNAALVEMMEGGSDVEPAAPTAAPDVADEGAAEDPPQNDQPDGGSEAELDSDLNAAPVAEDVEAEVLPDPPDDGPAARTPEAAMPTPSEASDLTCLPGAGPGLVWMLNACDIHCLKDLAEQDPTDLSAKLGVVGQIINVDHWVTLAQAGPRAD